MPTRFLLAVAVTAALAIAGCGGSSSNTQPSTPTIPVTKQSFLAQVNSLCTRANDAYKAAPTARGAVSVVERYVAIFKTVQAPPALKALYARYVAVLEKEAADLKKGDTAGLKHLRDTQARPLAKKLGATDCVTG